jgi:NADPH-dependent F420 reductase
LTESSSNALSFGTIAVIGGTGKEGSGLALRWAAAGLDVIIGSRQREKGERVAAELNERLGQDGIRGMDNLSAAEAGQVVVLSVPYAAHRDTLEQIAPGMAGKVLIDVTVPLNPPKVSQAYVPPEGPAAVQSQRFLGEDVQVVAAFQNVSAVHLADAHHAVDCDVLVCGDSAEAREVAVHLAEIAGMRGVHAGALANAVAVESLTPLLIAVNRRYKINNAGIRITGMPEG